MKDLIQQIQFLSETLLKNQEEIKILRQAQQPTPQPPVAPPMQQISYHKEPEVALPDKFNGERREFRNFVSSIENYFHLKASNFASDEIKTGFIGTLLRGDALAWFRSIQQRDDPCLRDLPLFKEAFTTMFGDPNVQATAQAKLNKLTQSNQSAAAYAAQFRQITCDTGYNDNANINFFRQGLRDDVKDVLAQTLFPPEDFQGLVDLAIRIDNRLFERRTEKRLKPSTTYLTPRDPRVFQSQRQFSPSPHQVQAHRLDHRTPMEVDTTKIFQPLTNEERQKRRRDNLCMYCGDPGHHAIACPKKRSRSHHHAAQITEIHPKNVSEQIQ